MTKQTTLICAVLLFLLTLQINSQWQQTTLNTGTIRGLAGDATYLYAAKTSVYVSSDNGTTWASIGPGSTIQDICLNGNNIFVATQNAGFYRTSDFGLNWAQNNMGADGVRGVIASGSNVFAGQQNYGLMMSTNNGINFNWVPGISESIPSVAANGSNIFAGTHGIYRSTNNGSNWERTLSIPYLVYSIAVNGSTIYAGSDLGGVYRSTDNGTIWLQTSLNNRIVISLAVSGSNIFAGTFTHGVYYSSNSGDNWIQVNEGLTSLDVEALLIYGSNIYAGTYNSGLFKRNLSELVAVNPISTEIPKEFSLSQNYPNPFNPTTNIKFSLPVNGFTTLNVYDAAGKLVSTLVNSEMKSETYQADFNASGLASGIYFYTLSSGEFIKTNKMVLVK